jgi:PAS domain S-box-containing protein
VSRMSGYSPDEILGNTPHLFSSGEHPKEFYQELWNTILSGRVWHGEMVNCRKDGHRYFEEQTITPVLDNLGNPAYFIAVKEDITERKLIEGQIREEAERAHVQAEIYRAIAEVSPDYARVVDTLACKLAQTIGDICTIHFLSDDGNSLELAAIQAPETADFQLIQNMLGRAPTLTRVGLAAEIMGWSRPVLVREYLGTHPDIPLPEEYWEIIRRMGISEILSTPLRAHNRPIGILTLARFERHPAFSAADSLMIYNLVERAALTILNARLHRDLERSLEQEQKTRAHLIQADRFSAVGRMVASITHEINNPLQTIKNCLYLARQEDSPGQAIEFLDMASNEIERLSDLVAQLRETYRPRAVGLIQSVDLNKLVGEVRLLLAPHMYRHHVTWDQNSPEEHPTVIGSADQLKQVFLNISLNAVEAMASAGGTLSVKFVPSSDRSKVGVAFTDTGPGISPEVLPRLFEPLFTTKPDGLGLGLSISKDIIDKHRGSIVVECPPEGGTRMVVWLPVNSPA